MTVDELEWDLSLGTAVARFDELRAREALADGPDDVPLSAEEALELLALSEVIARKAGYGRQLTIRTARAAGASWAQVGRALGISRQSAWESHARWIDGQEEQHRASDHEGLDEHEVAVARERAGTPAS